MDVYLIQSYGLNQVLICQGDIKNILQRFIIQYIKLSQTKNLYTWFLDMIKVLFACFL